MGWSYELLSPHEQRAFLDLSVLRGGCTVESAARVAGIDDELLRALLRRSLLDRRQGSDDEEPRLSMLETLRVFAAARLEHERRDELLEALCRYVFEAPGRGEVLSLERVAWLGTELDNVRAALSWAADTESVHWLGLLTLEPLAPRPCGSIADGWRRARDGAIE